MPVQVLDVGDIRARAPEASGEGMPELKVRCSTTELAAQINYSEGPLPWCTTRDLGQ